MDGILEKLRKITGDSGSGGQSESSGIEEKIRKITGDKGPSSQPQAEGLEAKIRRIVGDTSPTQEIDPSTYARFNLYTGTRGSGYNRDQSLQRIHDFNYSIKQGMHPDRAMEYASQTDIGKAPAKILTDQERQKIKQEGKAKYLADHASGKYLPGDIWHTVSGSPEEASEKYSQVYADRYSAMRAQGKTDEEARQYADSVMLPIVQKLGDWAGNTWSSIKESIGRHLGASDSSHVTPHDWAEAPLVASVLGKTQRDLQFQNFLDASSNDTKLGKAFSTIDLHLWRFLEGLTTPDMAAFEIASFGTGPLERGGLKAFGELEDANAATKMLGKASRKAGQVLGRALPKGIDAEGAVAQTERAERAIKAVQEARVPVSVQKVARTVKDLAHAGFTIQMAHGAAESTVAAVKAGFFEHRGYDALGYAVDALLNGLMAGTGMHEIDAKAKMRADLDAKTAEVYPEYRNPKFGKLSDYEQGVVITKLIEDSKDYTAAKDESQKEFKRRAKRLAYTENRALSEAWNADEVQRVRQDMMRARQKKAEEENEEKEQGAIKSARMEYAFQAAKGREIRLATAQMIADAREDARGQVEATVKALSDYANAPKATTPIHPVDGMEGVYQATYRGNVNHFGSDENGVYRRILDEKGDLIREERLDIDGRFYDASGDGDAWEAPDRETADAAAKISSASRNAQEALKAEGATAHDVEQDEKLAQILAELTRPENPITAKEALERAGIAQETQIPSQMWDAIKGDLRGPLWGRTKARFVDDLTELLMQIGGEFDDENVARAAAEREADAHIHSGAESNLHFVQKSGDYIISAKGIRWTLDDKGMLHSEEGNSLPLMKNGRYSNQAMQLARSGRVGTGFIAREAWEQRSRQDQEADRLLEQLRLDQIDAMWSAKRLAEQNAGLELLPSEPTPAAKPKRRPKSIFARPSPQVEPDEPVDQGYETALVAHEFRQAEAEKTNSLVEEIAHHIENASPSTDSMLGLIAERTGLSKEDVLGRWLFKNADLNTPEGRAAQLRPGDKIPAKNLAEKGTGKWVVDQSPTNPNMLQVRYPGLAPIPFDPNRPSPRIVSILNGVDVEWAPRMISEEDARRIVHESPYILTRNERVQAVKTETENPSKPPNTPEEAKVKAEKAGKRTESAISAAVEAVVQSQNPPATVTLEEADKAVDKAEELIKTAETAYAQQAKAESQTVPEGEFPQRAPVSVGLVGKKITLRQNQQQFPAHYEAVPIQSLQMSHNWEGNRQVPNEEYPSDLQPRTIDDEEQRMNVLRATPIQFIIREKAQFEVMELGGPDFVLAIAEGLDPTINDPRITPEVVAAARELKDVVYYYFGEYADKTINGAMGPAIIDAGGRVVGGNTRLAIMLKHLELLKGIQDPETQQASFDGFRAQMADLGREVGINIPNDGQEYVVVRMMDQPIKTTTRAVELGKLFNTKIGVEINEQAMAIAYGKLLDDAVMKEISEKIIAHDGILPAIQSNPRYFVNLMERRWKVSREERQSWYESDKLGNVQFKAKGKDMIAKILLGKVIPNIKILQAIKDEPAFRALGRALPNLLELRLVPSRDITGKIIEAVAAVAETKDADLDSSHRRDKWYATYDRDQPDLAGLESVQPDMPDRIVEAIYRALTEKASSKSATPTYFNKALEKLLKGREQQPSLTGSPTEDLQRPVDFFNTAFAPELEAIRKFRGDASKGISETEFQQALNNREMSDQEREDALREEQGKKPSEQPKPDENPKPAKKPVQNLERPVIHRPALDARVAKTNAARKAAQREMAKAKQSKGYITPDELKRYLEFDPVTKERADENFRVAKLMAEYVYDADAPEGVDRKDALAWVLERRVAGIGRKSGREAGAFVYPRGEEAFGRGFILMLNAAHEGTFIHEFAHAIFPMLSDEDIKAINSIRVDERTWRKTHPGSGWDYPEWDGKRDSLAGKVFEGVSEKFSYGLEKVLRDENPTGFSMEVKKVLEKVKKMFVDAYRKFADDPLSPLSLTDEAKEVFTKMLGITEMDAPDNFRKETEKARASDKKKVFAKPTEEPHPIQKIAKDLGARGIRKDISGDVLESTGDRVDPSKPTAVLIFSDVDSAAVAWMDNDKVPPNAELVEGTDGTYGIRFNTKYKIPNDVLYQDAPRLVKTQSPEFKEWFGDSKVVGEDGDPLMVFHGTASNFSTFDQSKSAENTSHPTSHLGFFFTADPSVASLFIGGVKPGGFPIRWSWKNGAQIMPVYLNIRHPFEMNADQWQRIVMNGSADGEPQSLENKLKYIQSQRALLEKQGYDGVRIIGNPKYQDSMTEEYGWDNWVAFKPEQIKSGIGNRGTFDPLNPDILYQDAPRKHPGIELEEKEAWLKKETNPMLRKLLEIRIQNLRNEIRAKYGVEAPAKVAAPEVAKAALKEIKDARAADIRRVPNETSRAGLPERTGGITKPPVVGMLRHAKPGDTGKRSGGPLSGEASLAEVKPVTLQPQPERGDPVGIQVGDEFNQKSWEEANRRDGLSPNTPPPTVALSPDTAARLKYGGQKQHAQLALSALQQGDGFLLASATGSGKTWVSMGVVREYMRSNPGAKILVITKNKGLLEKGPDAIKQVAESGFGFDVETKVPDAVEKGVYGTTYQKILTNDIYRKTQWDLVVADEAGEARNWYQKENRQGKRLMDVVGNSKKAMYVSATPFHSPMEYGYLEKLNLWPKGGFEDWIKQNFKYRMDGSKVVGELDPGKQAKLREQLVERGQMSSQMISYEGYTAHFGVVPISRAIQIALDDIHEGFSNLRHRLVSQGKKALADRTSAFEATYTKAYLERSRIPQAIELIRKARALGWRVAVFSETTAEDLFGRAANMEDEDLSEFQKLDREMNGDLSKIVPRFGNVYDLLQKAFGDEIVDYSGSGNTPEEREKAKDNFLAGKNPMLYTTYAAGGVGVSLHDKVGDKPTAAVFLGPPYSGVLLEQAMGRLWRFGTKSNVHSVFLASDSEPDIRLFATKIGPRMRALRASVLGEQDALGKIMENYTNEERTREFQDMLAYDQGNEVKVDAQSFTRKSRHHDLKVDNWSAISFPSAEEAKNKGMKMDVEGPEGNWSTLYQSQYAMFEGPRDKKIDDTINGIGQALSEAGVPSEDVGLTSGAASVIADGAPDGVDKAAAAKGVMETIINGEAALQDPETGGWTVPHEAIAKMKQEVGSGDEKSLKGLGRILNLMWSQELNIIANGKKVGAEGVARKIVRMGRDFYQDKAGHLGNFRMQMLDIFSNAGVDHNDAKLVRQVWDVVEGHITSSDEKINKAAQGISDFMVKMHKLMSDKNLFVKLKDGRKVFYKDFASDPNYMPHMIDWDAELTDPETGETKTLREIMGNDFGAAQRLKYLRAKARELGKPTEIAELWLEELRQKKLRTPTLGNVKRERSLNLPFIKKDFASLDSYMDQVSTAIALEDHFGSEMEKLGKEIAKLPNKQLRRDVLGAYQKIFEHQDWSSPIGELVRKGQSFEVVTKMLYSPLKVGWHVLHSTIGLGGRMVPTAKAIGKWAENPKAFMREKYYMGVVNMRLNPYLLEGGKNAAGNTFFKYTGFDKLYAWVRAIDGEAAKITMEQEALPALRKGGKAEKNMRRLLKEYFLIGDGAIDQALESGRWDEVSLAKAQRAFADKVAFSAENPLQMPALSRMSMDESLTTEQKNVAAAIRASYMLQSFTVKTFSLLRESLYEEVVIHHNLRPLVPFLLLYPLAGQAMMGATAGAKAAVHRGWEKMRGKEHEHDQLDTWLQQFDDIKDHPFIGPLRIYLDGMLMAATLDRTKRVTDFLMLLGMGQKKPAEDTVKYFPEDLIEEGVGTLAADIWSAMVTTPVKEVRDAFFGSDKTHGTRMMNDLLKEIERLFPVTKGPLQDDTPTPKTGWINTL